jgi:hypothetical protein
MKRKTEKLFATLTSGKSYTLVDPATDKDKVFLEGQPVEITPAEKAHLELHAVDRVTRKSNNYAYGGTETSDVPKFKFEVVKAA